MKNETSMDMTRKPFNWRLLAVLVIAILVVECLFMLAMLSDALVGSDRMFWFCLWMAIMLMLVADLDALPARIAKPQNVSEGQAVADAALTLLRDNGRLLPLTKSPGTSGPALPYQSVEEVRSGKVLVIFTDDVRMDSGRILERQLQARAPGSTVFYVDPRFATAMTDEILKNVESANAVIAAVYAVPVAGRAIAGKNGLTNTVSMAEESGALLQKILDRASARTIVLAMGNPYLAQDFRSVQTYICAFSNASVSEVSVAKAIFGEIPIRGRLPVTIPNFAQRGAGLDRAALALHGESHHAQASR